MFPFSVANYYGVEAEFLLAKPNGEENVRQFVQTCLQYLHPSSLDEYRKTRGALVVGKVLAESAQLDYPFMQKFRVTPLFDTESNLAPFAYAWLLAAGTNAETFVNKGPNDPIAIHIHHRKFWDLVTWGPRFREAVGDASIHLGLLGYPFYAKTTPREIIRTIARARFLPMHRERFYNEHMADPGAGDMLTKSILELIKFTTDPMMKGLTDGSDKYITIGDLTKTIGGIGDPQMRSVLPFAARSALKRIFPTGSQDEFRKQYEQVLKGDIPGLRIQKDDITNALTLMQGLRANKDRPQILQGAQKEASHLISHFAPKPHA